MYTIEAHGRIISTIKRSNSWTAAWWFTQEARKLDDMTSDVYRVILFKNNKIIRMEHKEN